MYGCNKEKESVKFQPYLMMVSIVFLLATLIIYSIIPKDIYHKKENFEAPTYHKLRCHCAFSLMMAFIVMIVIQLHEDLGEKSPVLCTTLGKIDI